ncbi:MAG: domain protein beta Propeller [Acidimicrobiales bacterium]|nr:domain protein beta Propeller [Acidimicrobiales bacterium]
MRPSSMIRSVPTRTTRSTQVLAGVLTAFLAVAAAAPAGAIPISTVTLVSSHTSGALANGQSNQTMISSDAQVVVFRSAATNFVDQPTTGIQLYAESKGADGRSLIEKVSVSSNEVEDTSTPKLLAVSATGRFVVFQSGGTKLVAGDTNGRWDVFIRDRQLGTTERVSVKSGGKESTTIDLVSRTAGVTPDGRFVVFEAKGTDLDPLANLANTANIFVRDRIAGTTKLVSATLGNVRGNADSRDPSISDDGKVIAFSSLASNLVAGDTNGQYDVFVRNISLLSLKRVSVTTNGVQGNNASIIPDLSANGTRVLFLSTATNLVAGDTNSWNDLFLRDLTAGTTRRVGLSSTNEELQGNAEFSQGIHTHQLSPDGKTVLFVTSYPNVVPNQPACFCLYRRGVDPGGEPTSVAAVTWDGKAVPQPAVTQLLKGYDVSADGKSVVFIGTDGLTSNDKNNFVDVGRRTITG